LHAALHIGREARGLATRGDDLLSADAEGRGEFQTLVLVGAVRGAGLALSDGGCGRLGEGTCAGDAGLEVALEAGALIAGVDGLDARGEQVSVGELNAGAPRRGAPAVLAAGGDGLSDHLTAQVIRGVATDGALAVEARGVVAGGDDLSAALILVEFTPRAALGATIAWALWMIVRVTMRTRVRTVGPLGRTCDGARARTGTSRGADVGAIGAAASAIDGQSKPRLRGAAERGARDEVGPSEADNLELDGGRVVQIEPVGVIDLAALAIERYAVEELVASVASAWHVEVELGGDAELTELIPALRVQGVGHAHATSRLEDLEVLEGHVDVSALNVCWTSSALLGFSISRDEQRSCARAHDEREEYLTDLHHIAS
jgi:hypothetical protein